MPKSNPNKPEHIRLRQTEASRRYRAKHRDKVNESHKKIYWDRRKRALDLLGGSFCVNCGCDEVSFLEINHKNGGGCKEIRAHNRGLTDLVLMKKRSFEDLNVLCRVCNALDHLARKNPELSNGFRVVWEQFTGLKAEKIS